MPGRHVAVAPAPVPVVAGAGAPATPPEGAFLHPKACETCVECWYPIGRNEPVRAVLTGQRPNPNLLGFVHVEACSDRLAEKCSTFEEYRQVNARLVDLG